MKVKMLLSVFLCYMFFVACSGGSSKSSNSGSSDDSASAGQSTEAPTVSIDKDLEDISHSTGGAFRVSGNCSEEGLEVTVDIGGIIPATQPSCTSGAWNVQVDVSGFATSPISITVDHSNSEGAEATQATQSVTNNFVCPSNFVAVPALTGYTTDGFCVAKYEMKQDDSNGAVSQADDLPWSNIFKADAILGCTTLGSGYDLITNDEWQTLARNIELVASNWNGNTVGSIGGLNRGHSDNSPASLIAASDDDSPCFDTEQSCDATTWDREKRTHTLSGGEVIWDVGGNVAEWVKDENTSIYGARAYLVDVTRTSHRNSFSLSGGITTTSRLAKDQFGPTGDYPSQGSGDNRGLGYAYLHRDLGVVRGGSFLQFAYAGVFTTSLSFNSSSRSNQIGFRCVYHFSTP